jgi:hypothetical protein
MDGEIDEDDKQEALRQQVRGWESLPHIVPAWCPSPRFWHPMDTHRRRYRSWILIVPKDCHTWEDSEKRGLWWVEFNQDVTLMMETSTEDYPEGEGDLISGGWVIMEQETFVPPVRMIRVSMQDLPPLWFMKPSHEDLAPNDDFHNDLYHEGSSFTLALND